jgi:hypothetical protein
MTYNLRGSRRFIRASNTTLISQRLVLNPPFTYLCRFNVSSLPTSGQEYRLISIGSTSDVSCSWLGLNNDAGTPKLRTVSFTNPSAAIVNYISTPALNTWHSLGGNHESNVSRVAVFNGAFSSTEFTNLTTTNQNRLGVGCAAYAGGLTDNVANALIADVAFYNVVLSQEEHTRYAKGESPASIRPGNLVSYLPFVDWRNVDYVTKNSWTVYNALADGGRPQLPPIPISSRRVWVQLGPAAGGGTTTTIAPSKGSLAVAGYAPGVVRTANQAVAPTIAHATITGRQPGVVRTANQTIAPTLAHAALTGRAPGIEQDIGVAPTIGHLTATGRQPGITQNVTSFIAPSKGALTVTGKQPALEQTANQTIAPSKGAAYLAGYAPVVEIAGGSQILLPDKGALTLTGYAPEVSTGGELGGKPVFARRRKRYLVKDRVYDDLDPADVIAAAAEVGIDLGDVREVVKEPTQQKSAPRRADDDGREYWLPQEFWGRAAARQKLEATAPLGDEFQRAVEAIRASAGPMQARMALRRRQEEEAIILLMA